MTLLIFGLVLLMVFLAGTLVIAGIIKLRYGDTSASYPLYAVRDSLIHAVAIDGVPRDNPWVESLYEDLNGLLWNSQAIAGFDGWERAGSWGAKMAEEPRCERRFPTFPRNEDPPAALMPVIVGLRDALDHFVKHHHGFHIQWSSRQARHAKIQRERARQMREKIPTTWHGAVVA